MQACMCVHACTGTCVDFMGIYIKIWYQNELDATKNDLASQRIAFEEEKLSRLDDEGLAAVSEAEALRIKLKQQVNT